MSIFKGFSPPSEHILLQQEGYKLEIWPQLGGSIAHFDYVYDDGRCTHLFRPTEKRTTYLPTDLACWPLVPYSNRIRNGKFIFEGKAYTLAMNVPEHPHALHGVGWQRPWQTIAHSLDNCRLRLDHEPDIYWPFAFSAEQSFTLDKDGLRLATSITNKHNGSMPCGLGQHPYVMRPTGTKLSAQVNGVWLTDYTIMPVYYTTDIPPQWDVRKTCILDGALMDSCFDGLRGNVEVLWPDNSRLIIKGSDNLKYLVVYNSWEDDYVCIEPVSHMTDAINRTARGETNTGFKVLAPGETAEMTYQVTYHPA